MIDLTDDLDPDNVPDDWWLERMRLHRNDLLAASDWTQAADDPTGKLDARPDLDTTRGTMMDRQRVAVLEA